jgi:hypothetical protein
MAKSTSRSFKFTPAHERYCQHYSEYGNSTQAFLYAWPNSTYNTAKTEGPKLLQNLAVSERVEHLKEEFAVQYSQTREGTTRDLINAAEEAKKAGQFSAYAKLRDMVIKMCGFYSPDKIEHSSNPDAPFIINIIQPKDGNTAD